MPPSSDPACRVLFEMFSTPRGKVSLGRVDLGAGAGRIVLLREMTDSASPEAAPAADVTKGFAHPQLLKLVGMLSDGTRNYIASEYLPGLSLFELTARARARQRSFEVAAAVRIVLDVLRLVERVETLLRRAGRPRVRLLYPDCVWIADYGETLLSEAGVAAYLASGRAMQEVDEGPQAIERDVMTAVVELFHLATAQLMTGDLAQAVKQHLPPELASVLRAVLMVQSSPDEQLSSLIEGLAALPPALLGTERQVATELRRVAPELLDERHNKLAELSGRGSPDIDSPTKVYGADITAGIDPDEVTVEVRKAFRGRPVARMPAAARRPSTAATTSGRQGSVSRREPPAAARWRISRQQLLWGLALLALTGATAGAFLNPAWLRDLAHRVGIGH